MSLYKGKNAVEYDNFHRYVCYVLPHEVKNALTCLCGGLSILSSRLDLDGSPYSKDANDLHKATLDMVNRIVRLLTAMKISDNWFVLQQNWISVDEIIANALKILEPKIKAQTFKINIPDAMPLFRGDACLLEMALVNVIDNALNYAPPDAVIEFDISLKGKFINISISDNGSGFEPGTERAIFTRFMQSATVCNANSTGIGLAMVRLIIERHGGTVLAANKSRPKGACINICLPRSLCLSHNAI